MREITIYKAVDGQDKFDKKTYDVPEVTSALFDIIDGAEAVDTDTEYEIHSYLHKIAKLLHKKGVLK